MPSDPSPRRIAAARPYFPEEDLEEIHRGFEQVVRSGRLILGERTEELEAAFREYTGAPCAVAVSSGTAALQIALRYFEVEGREVVLPTNNFPGVVSAVLYEGGIPVLAEMDPATFCVDAADALRRITPKARGVMVTHVAGLVDPSVERLRDACAAGGLFLLEDASHAHGASAFGRKAGTFADAGCFSFYPTKIMTTATGGMLTTPHAGLAEFARSVRHHGQGAARNEFVRLGNDWCMSELHAVLGLQQLRRLDENVAHRNRVVEWYRERLGDESWITIPTPPAHARHAYYKVPMLLREGIDGRRFRQILESELGVENGSVYDPPCHLQPVFRDLLALPAGTFPQAEAALARQVCPPVHSSLEREDVEDVVLAMRTALERA